MEPHQHQADLGFAERSARYLADRGCTKRQIRQALVEQLDLNLGAADRVVASMVRVDGTVPRAS